jgi:hypothetical protein
MRKTVPDGILANFDSESWCEVLPPKHAKDINVPHAIPVLH